MSVPLIELQSMLDDVVRAIGNPVLSIRRSDGSQLQYRSMAEALSAKSTLESQIAKASGGETRVGLAQHKRGQTPLGAGSGWSGGGRCW